MVYAILASLEEPTSINNITHHMGTYFQLILEQLKSFANKFNSR